MKTEISYSHLPRAQADEKAIADCLEYLTPKQWQTLEACMMDPNTPISRLNIYFGFVGITGYPFFAMMRKYRLEDFKAAVVAEGGAVDDHGFHLDLQTEAA